VWVEELRTDVRILGSIGGASRAEYLHEKLFVARKFFVIACAKKFRVDAPTIENNFGIFVRKYFHPYPLEQRQTD
jgi:hypothetical protein